MRLRYYMGGGRGERERPINLLILECNKEKLRMKSKGGSTFFQAKIRFYKILRLQNIQNMS